MPSGRTAKMSRSLLGPTSVNRIHDSTPLGWVVHGSVHSGGARERAAVYAAVAQVLLTAGASIVDARPRGRGQWAQMLIAESSPEVAEVLRRHGADGPEQGT